MRMYEQALWETKNKVRKVFAKPFPDFKVPATVEFVIQQIIHTDN